jgi:CRP/FNR family transcriptional regulator, transcriptional activator FtrB
MRPSDHELFTRTDLYRHVGAAVAERLTRGCAVHAVASGAEMTRQGSMADAVHVILSGRVSLTAEGGGSKTVITTFGAGEMFVTPAAILDLPYLVSARTTTRSRVLLIPSERFRRALQAEHALALMIVMQLARHWRLLLTQIQDLKLRSARERLVAFLLRQCPSGKGRASFRLPNKRNVVAAELGMSPESLSRTFQQLRALGVDARGSQVVIADVARLASLGPPTDRPRARRRTPPRAPGGRA